MNNRTTFRMLAVLLLAAAWVPWHAHAAERAVMIATPAVDDPKAAGSAQTLVLSGGCFWGVQGVYEHVRGVRRAIAGYAGGGLNTAHYDQVGTGRTGHAESVQISFDPAQISVGELLQIFFSVVQDPTQLNGQGPDTGPQYRSEIWYGNATQKQIAEAYIAQLDQSHVFRKPIVTRVDALPGFFPAEGYHQDFLVHNPTYPYIVYNDLPKIENLKRLFPAYYVPQPTLVSNVISR
ncbi:MAG TPA: peptide-methionine (S)-S-oxide reductase MsrA [Steroidobacteraceae bacterium]|jgi:peptide-methionine (S)-S-oxide reductase